MIGALQMRLTRSNFFVPLMTLVISCIAANVQAQPAANVGSYIFALSWSPGFCDMEGDRERRPECRRGANLGFVIHGLWANDNNGQEIICDGGDDLSDRGKSRASAVFSDTGRANHEWKAHWSCLGVSEDDFVDAVTKARALISIPESLAAPSAPQSLDPEDIRFMVEQFLPGRTTHERRRPDVSPLYAELDGMPPALFTVGTADHLMDDTLFFAPRWVAAGNRAELLVYPDAPHGCIGVPTVLGHWWPRLESFLGACIATP